jgi:signal transduction histidine kinase
LGALRDKKKRWNFSFSIRTKLILIVAGTLFVAIISSAWMIRGLVYQNIVDQKMTTVDILTQSLLNDIKYGTESLDPNSVRRVIAKYMTYYRVMERISVYDDHLIDIADSSPERKGQITQDSDIIAAVNEAKPTLKIIQRGWQGLRLRSIAPILQGSKIVGAAVSDISIEDIQTTIGNIEKEVLSILLVTVLAASGMLAVLLQGSVLKRLSRLMAVTHQIAAGDYTVQVVDSSTDEIGQLNQAFNMMASELSKSKQKIEDYNKELEERVREQTAALHKTYEDLKNAQSQLVLNEKMASLGLLIAGIAHEINTPVGAIQNVSSSLNTKILSLPRQLEALKQSASYGSDELIVFFEDLVRTACDNDRPVSYGEVQAVEGVLKREGMEDFRAVAGSLVKLRFVDTERIAKYKAFIKDPVAFSLARSLAAIAQVTKVCQTSSQKISEIVRALKYYAYTDKDKIERIQVNESIQTSLVLLRNRLKRNIVVSTDLDPELPKILCTSEIHQVWTNLLTNACDAIEEMEADYQGEISISTRKKEDGVLVTVADNGIGIPECNLDRIFDPFFTTKEIGKGTGLGLSIVSGIIKKHNGTTRVRSGEGRTVFEVVLPLTGAFSGSSEGTTQSEGDQGAMLRRKTSNRFTS